MSQNCTVFSGKRSMRLSSLFVFFSWYLFKANAPVFFSTALLHSQDVYFWRIECVFGKIRCKRYDIHARVANAAEIRQKNI